MNKPATKSNKGVLLLNLGSPDSTDTQDVRKYLREFLSDPRVIDAPAPVRQTILNLFILPFRPRQSAEAYEKIWTDDGSPLIVTSYQVTDLLGERVDIPVELGMRYGSPSTEDAIRRLKGRGINDLLIIPLYPHYAMSSYETAVAKAQEVIEQIAPEMRYTVQAPYYNDPDYIDALAEVTRATLEEEEWDHVLFSYHGIPERHIRKGDPSGCFCLRYEDCCQREHPAQAMCYRHQVFKTSSLVAEVLDLPREKYSVTFQSRLGNDPWLKPFTDHELERFPTRGIKKLVVLCPAFVSDCLETLEEIAMEGKETFEEAGGKHFVYVPCLNDHPRWIDVLEKFTRTFMNKGGSPVKLTSSQQPAAE